MWCVLAVELCGRRTYGLFFLSGGRFFNGAEAELRRDGVAVFVGLCDFCLFFVWCAPAFYFGFGNFCLELTKGGDFFMMFL